MARGCFITATDTGVGKTILAAALLASLASRGLTVRARKPVITGTDVHDADGAPQDHELLAAITGEQPEAVSPVRFGPAVGPALAAELAGVTIDPETSVLDVLAAGEDADVVIVEGTGGLLVPLGEAGDVRRLIAAIGLPVIIAARATLGTLNHTLLTIEAARAGRLDVRAVVLTPWPTPADVVAQSNRATIERLSGVDVATLPAVSANDRAALAAAGNALPYERWLRPLRAS